MLAETAEEAAQKLSTFVHAFLSCCGFDIEESEIEVSDE